MKKSIFILGALMTFIIYGSCSLIKVKPNLEEIQRQKSKKEVEVKKDELHYNTKIDKGVTENTSKDYTEDVTIKINPEPIQLTATFRLDTDKTLKDTIKLVDINDSRVSVAIYQNKKTNELTAKITDKRGSKDIPFTELKIKRNYSEKTSKVDTTKISVDSIKVSLDSTQITREDTHLTNNKWSWQDYIIPTLSAVLLAYVLYKLFKHK